MQDPRKEVISIEQLFQEELDAVVEMTDALLTLLEDHDQFRPEYWEIKSEVVKLEQTAEYLMDRLDDNVPCKHLRK